MLIWRSHVTYDLCNKIKVKYQVVRTVQKLTVGSFINLKLENK